VSSRLRNAATLVTVSLRGPVRGAVGGSADGVAPPGYPGGVPGAGAAPAGLFAAGPAAAVKGSRYGGRWLPRGACW